MADPNPIVVLGSGDHAKVVYDALHCAGRSADVRCFVNFADESHGVKSGWMGVTTYLSWTTFLQERHDVDAGFVVALGNNERRRRAFDLAVAAGLRPTTVVHPRAIVSLGASIGAGTMVSANCLIGVGASIGVNCVVNSGAIVDHDCTVGSHATVAPSATLAGRVIVGDLVTIGMGAAVLDELRIGAGSTVAAGAVVTRDVPAGVMVAGVPAAIKKRLGVGT